MSRIAQSKPINATKHHISSLMECIIICVCQIYCHALGSKNFIVHKCLLLLAVVMLVLLLVMTQHNKFYMYASRARIILMFVCRIVVMVNKR